MKYCEVNSIVYLAFEKNQQHHFLDCWKIAYHVFVLHFKGVNAKGSQVLIDEKAERTLLHSPVDALWNGISLVWEPCSPDNAREVKPCKGGKAMQGR